MVFFIAGLQPEVKGRSAPRPNELPLRHTTSTDTLTNVESQEEQNYEPQVQHEGWYVYELSVHYFSSFTVLLLCSQIFSLLILGKSLVNGPI